MSQVWHNTVQLVLHGTRDWRDFVTATYRLSIGDVSKWRPKTVEVWKRHSEIWLYIMIDCDWQLFLMILDEAIWLRIGSLEWIKLLYTQQCSPTIIMNTAYLPYGIIWYHHHLSRPCSEFHGFFPFWGIQPSRIQDVTGCSYGQCPHPVTGVKGVVQPLATLCGMVCWKFNQQSFGFEKRNPKIKNGNKSSWHDWSMPK